jgi:hypothetical protein
VVIPPGGVEVFALWTMMLESPGGAMNPYTTKDIIRKKGRKLNIDFDE